MRNAAGLGALLLLFSASQIGTSMSERLASHRNLGKAFYENPTTQAQAVDEFRNALALQPTSARERLNYGLALLRAGQTEQGIAELEKTQKQDPAIPHTWFNLGIQYKRKGEPDKSKVQLLKMVELVPGDPITHYNLGVIEKMNGRMQQAATSFETAVRLDGNLAAPHFQLFNLYRQMEKPADSQKHLTEFQRLKKEQEGAAIPEDMEWNRYAEVLDEIEPARKADRLPATFEIREISIPGSEPVLSVVRFGNGAIALTGKSAWLVQSKQPPKILPALAGAIAVAVGDYDNDGVADLCVVTASEVFLSKNFVKGPVVAKGKFRKAIWIDYDHDYDLDLLLLGEESLLLRNQGPAGWVDKTSTFPFAKARAIDAVAFRYEAETKGWDLAVTYADHESVLYRDQLGGIFKAEPIPGLKSRVGIDAIDFDHDGEMDLRAGKDLLYNRMIRGRRSWSLEELSAGFDTSIAVADDIVSITSDKKLIWAANKTPGANWLHVQLTGVKNLKLAQGSEVEVKAGRYYEKQIYNGDPISFNLGANKKAEVVRITWPNGLIQNEVNAPTAVPLKVKEAQRLSGSCPMIWTWNGREFEFITDILGVAPLGASSGDGEYFPVDHDEYIQIPSAALKLENGKFQVRITEELSEVAYLDEVALVAVDHPSSQQIFIADRFKAPPFPQFKIYPVTQRLPLISAFEDGRKDALAALAKKDQIYPKSFKRNSAGVAEMHTLELKLAPGSDLLILNGWVDWADGSTFLGAAQESKDGLVFPRLEVLSEGKWKMAIEDMGLPAGKPKTIVVELPESVSRLGAKVRVVTNLSLYWDEIFTAHATDFHGRTTPMHAATAVTRFRGFSKAIIHPDRLQPERFLYSPSSPVSMWNQTPGLYTRYGDVRDLLHTDDDRFLIMGSGDEVQLEFDAAQLPPLPNGWTRSFLLKVDGWAKDRDANTAFSQSVEPLPFHNMSRYPYPASEHFPDSESHAKWRKDYNTRPAMRTLRPMVTSR